MNTHLKIMKNLTASGKSVYWTMANGEEVVCRVFTKKRGQDLVDLINQGVIDFGFEQCRKERKAYILHEEKRICRMSAKAYNLLKTYIAERCETPSKLINNPTKEINNHDYYQPDSYNCQSSIQPEFSSESQTRVECAVEDCTPASEPSVRVESDSQTDFRQSQSLCTSQSLGASDQFEQDSSIFSIQRFEAHVQPSDEIFRQLERLDQKLLKDVEEGNRLIDEGQRLVASRTRNGKKLGESLIGEGQLKIRIANLRRGQTEIALDQRRIGQEQQRLGGQMLDIEARQQSIRERQQSIRERQQSIREGLNAVREGQQSIREGQQSIREGQEDIARRQQQIGDTMQQAYDNFCVVARTLAGSSPAARRRIQSSKVLAGLLID